MCRLSLEALCACALYKSTFTFYITPRLDNKKLNCRRDRAMLVACHVVLSLYYVITLYSVYGEINMMMMLHVIVYFSKSLKVTQVQ